MCTGVIMVMSPSANLAFEVVMNRLLTADRSCSLRDSISCYACIKALKSQRNIPLHPTPSSCLTLPAVKLRLLCFVNGNFVHDG